jgi:hypothetical protein
VNEILKKLDAFLPQRETKKIKLINSFCLYCVFVLNVSQNDTIIQNLIKIAEYGNFIEISQGLKKFSKDKRNVLNEYLDYDNNKYMFKISENISNEITIKSIYSKPIQLKISVFNSNLKPLMENSFLNNNLEWLSIISFYRHISITNLFFKISFYYINLFPEKYSLMKKQYITNYYLDNILPLFENKSGKLKSNLNENEKLLLMKNFILSFKSGDSTDSERILEKIKICLKKSVKCSSKYSFLNLVHTH